MTSSQVVYNANKLSKLVKKKKKLQNWLVYYQNKLERTSERPQVKVFNFNLTCIQKFVITIFRFTTIFLSCTFFARLVSLVFAECK